MTYHFVWHNETNGNQTATLHTKHLRHEITKHISDADVKGPYYSVTTYDDQNNKLATNVTFGETESELCSVINEIINCIKEVS